MTRNYGYADCARCELRFKKRASNSVCCDECQPKRNTEKAKERYDQAGLITRDCVHCGVKFKSKSGRGKYCPKCKRDFTKTRIIEGLKAWREKRNKVYLGKDEAYLSLIVVMAKSCPGPTEEPCSTCFFDTLCPKQEVALGQCIDAII